MLEANHMHALSPFVAFVVAIIVVPITIRLALARGWVDQPGGRKAHRVALPRIGGIALFLGTWLGYSFYVSTRSGWPELSHMGSAWALLGPSFLVFLLGLYDDFLGANALKKIVVQLLAATWAVSLGFRVTMLFDPLTESVVVTSGALSWILSIAWIIFITNAVNLIDGMDGLASGVVLIMSLTIFFIAFHLGLENIAFLSLAIGAACLAFLVFNFYPARIFMGDSGALFLGFMLGCMTLEANIKRSAAIVILGPPLVLALPILDSVLAMGRRFFLRREELLKKYGKDAQSVRRGWEVLRLRLAEVFQADQEHIHHVLLSMGLSTRASAFVLYGITALLGVTAYRTTVYDAFFSSFVVFVLLSLGLICIRRLHRRGRSFKATQQGSSSK